VGIISDSSASGDPTSTAVTVVSPGVELPNGFGTSSIAENVSIDLEASSVELLFTRFLGVGSLPFQGLRFSGLDSPGEMISGFEVQSSIGGVIDIFDPGAITFGSNWLDVDLQNTGSQTYSAGDFVRIELQFASNIPEPASLLLLAVAGAAIRFTRRSTL
jgi:hypothetical protein